MTKDEMIRLSVSLSKLSFTLLIWHSFEVHEEISVLIRSLYVRCESTITPKSFALNTGLISLLKNERVIVSGSFFDNWGVPITRNLVLPGLTDSWVDITSVNFNSKKVYEDEIFGRQDILQSFSGESKDDKYM